MTGDVAIKIIEKWQIPNGIDILHEKMRSYYDNYRFEVLKRRAEKTIQETRSVLQNLLERYSTGELNDSDASAEILMDI